MRRWIVGLVAAAVMAALALGVPPAAMSQRPGGTLRMGTGVEPLSLDPHHYRAGGIDLVVISLVTDGLVWIDRSLKLVPRLAESWEWVDTKTLRFKLRKGVVFSDGTPWNAEAARLNFERMMKAAEVQGFFGQLAGADVVDDATILLRLKNPYAPILRNLAAPVGGMLSPKAIREQDRTMARRPVGTGPFVVEEWLPRERLVLARNPRHWGTPPKLDRIQFRPFPEESTRLLAFHAGELDVIQNPVPSTVKALERDQRYQVLRVTQTRNLWMGFKMQDPLVGRNLKLRQAVAHAINRTALVRLVAEGLAIEARSFFPTIVIPLPPSAYPYDTSAAKRLLAEAGFAQGVRLQLRAPQARYLKDREIAEAIQEQLKVVGIQTDLKIMEWGAFSQDLLKHEGQQLWIQGWGFLTGDPDAPRGLLYSGGPFNSFGLRNPRVDSLFDRGTTTLDEDQRKTIYAELDRVLVREEAVVVPIYFQVGFFAITRKVRDLYLHPLELIDVSTTWLSQ
ncbi:MAG: hypothetical protein HY660_00965 [Armatimonadetes bacterium]|nr:hypothetical protein [Armatimonadota bacterium]